MKLSPHISGRRPLSIRCGGKQKPSAPSCRARNSPWQIFKFVSETQARWFISTDKRQVGKWMKDEMSLLGPAFIKLGQFLSTRPDLLGKEAADELSKLQDDIVPTNFANIKEVMEDSIGHPLEKTFAYVEPNSIASASIGQVHRARLLDGTDVVVKVLKPCVAKQIRDDLETLNMLNELFAQTGSLQAVEVDKVLKEYSRFLSAELDYHHEAHHMMRFHDLLDGMSVKIPRVYKEYSSNVMLVMEYVASTKITNVDEMRAKGYDTTRIAESLVQLFLYQIIYMGYVHCDPHPGNIGVAEDGETIVLYDFGNVIHLSQQFRKEINNLIFSIFQRDVDEFVHILSGLRIIQVQDEVEKLEIKEFFRSFFKYLENVDFQKLRDSIVRNGKDSAGSNVNIRVDPDFLSLFRVFSLLDGTCVLLDPAFNYIEILRPYADDILRDSTFLQNRMIKDFEKLRSYPIMVQSTDNNIMRLQKRVNLMNATMQKIQLAAGILLMVEHPEWIPVFGVIAASIVVVNKNKPQ